MKKRFYLLILIIIFLITLIGSGIYIVFFTKSKELAQKTIIPVQKIMIKESGTIKSNDNKPSKILDPPPEQNTNKNPDKKFEGNNSEQAIRKNSAESDNHRVNPGITNFSVKETMIRKANTIISIENSGGEQVVVTNFKDGITNIFIEFRDGKSRKWIKKNTTEENQSGNQIDPEQGVSGINKDVIYKRLSN